MVEVWVVKQRELQGISMPLFIVCMKDIVAPGVEREERRKGRGGGISLLKWIRSR